MSEEQAKRDFPTSKLLHPVLRPEILRPEGLRGDVPLGHHTDNEKFAEIALSLKFCTSDQIRQCLKIQGDTTENLSLGNSLMREGFISEQQYSQVLQRLRLSLKKGSPAPPVATAPTAEDREDELLGKLAVREGWLTTTDLQVCLQSCTTPRRTLAEILVTRGYLTASRARELLARVSRRLMCCRGCERTFTVLSIADSKRVACPQCHGALEDGKLPDRPPARDPLATQTFKAVSQTFKEPRRPRGR